MTTTQRLARFGATFALAISLVTATGTSLAFADEGEPYDPSAAPFVLETVNAGVQTAAGATELGLGIGAAASEEAGLGLGVGVGATEVGAAAAGLGLGIPAAVLGAP